MRGYTVEMSFLMPVVLLLIMSSILGVFYFHDKNIIAGAAYETAVAGSTKAREKGGADKGELERLFEERVGGKCILFPGVSGSVTLSKEEIEVTGTARKGKMSVSVLKRMPVTDPEQKIRDVRRLKGLGNGEKNNN